MLRLWCTGLRTWYAPHPRYTILRAFFPYMAYDEVDCARLGACDGILAATITSSACAHGEERRRAGLPAKRRSRWQVLMHIGSWQAA